MTKISILLLIVGLTTVMLSVDTQAQKTHPKKKIFHDVASWRATAPGKVKLKNFAPFRAIYDRTYKQGSGRNSGDIRQDRVIISAEEAGWDGQSAVAITLIDSGIAEQADTNARVLTMFVDRKNLSVFFEIGPIPGKAKDYYIARVDKKTMSMSAITTATQKLKPEKMPNKEPGFGPAAWAIASMGLSKGKKIKLAPNYSPDGNPLTAVNTGHIAGKRKFTDGSGIEYQAWILETTKSFTSPSVKHIYLINKPPYYLGTETVNLETDERKPFVWLRNVEVFDQQAEETSVQKNKAVKPLTNGSNAIPDKKTMTKGIAAYSQGMCAKCHGKDGTGSNRGPDLSDADWLHCDGSVKGIREILVSGVPKASLRDKTRPFGMNPATNLIKDEMALDALSQYVFSLSKN